jgi:hypothetical protein
MLTISLIRVLYLTVYIRALRPCSLHPSILWRTLETGAGGDLHVELSRMKTWQGVYFEIALLDLL